MNDEYRFADYLSEMTTVLHYLRNAYLAQFPSRGVDDWLKREGDPERASEYFRSRYPNFFYGDGSTEFIEYVANDMIETVEV